MTDTLKFKINDEVNIDSGCHCISFERRNGDTGIVFDIDMTYKAYKVRHSSTQNDWWHRESCLTKLQEKPMQNMQDIKVGDQVKVLLNAKEIVISTIGAYYWCNSKERMVGKCYVVDEITEAESVKCARIKTYYFPLNALEKIPQKPAQEIKLEVGQKYELIEYPQIDKTKIENPCTFVYEDTERDLYLLFDKDRQLFWYSKYWHLKVKKHSEPFKQKISGYFIYEDKAPSMGIALDEIVKKYSYQYIYTNFDEAKSAGDSHYPKIGKITLDAVVEYDVKE